MRHEGLLAGVVFANGLASGHLSRQAGVFTLTYETMVLCIQNMRWISLTISLS
jgi:hypothetical protein